MSDIKPFDYERFKEATFSSFKEMAVDPTLSCYEKIGFPDAYREGKENLIFQDILLKLSRLQEENQQILDIGPGCSQLPHILIDYCRLKKHRLILIDSKEMLDQLPNEPFMTKLPFFYPNACKQFIKDYQGQIDVILSYSVMQYIFAEANIYDFIDGTLSLLSEGGQFLIGDIPNASKRNRFLNSSSGVKYHQQHYGKGLPNIEHLKLIPNQMDDAVLMGILLRSRQAGYDAYVMPQSPSLPMANRREDLLIIRP